MKTVIVLVLFALTEGCASRADPPEKQASQTERNTPAYLFQIAAADRSFTVAGEVREPGRHLWKEGLTLTNAIKMAGGFTDFADRSRLEIRRSNGTQERHNYVRIINGLTNCPVVMEADVIVVPKRSP